MSVRPIPFLHPTAATLGKNHFPGVTKPNFPNKS